MEKLRIRAGALIIQDGNILLVEYRNDEDDGVHYNYPAGGVEPGETLEEAVKREAKEEASVEIDVGHVAFVYEYQPTKNDDLYGDVHSIGITFACTLKEGSTPKLPDSPDPHQTAVRWIPISQLDTIQLYPEIAKDIQNYYYGKAYRNYIEESYIQRGKSHKEENKHTTHKE